MVLPATTEHHLFFAIEFHSSCLLSLSSFASRFPILISFLTPSTAITILPHYSNFSTIGQSLISELFQSTIARSRLKDEMHSYTNEFVV